MLKIEESKSRSRRWSPLLVLLAISIGLVAVTQSGVLGLAEQAAKEKSAGAPIGAGGKLRTELANILQDLLNEYKSQSTGIDGYIKSLEKSLEEAKTDAERRALRWEIGQMEMMRAAFDTRKKDLEEEIKSLREEKRDGSVAEMIRRELEITKLFADYLRAVGDQPEKVARFEQLIKELEKLKLVCDFLKNSLPPGKPKPEEKEEPKPPAGKPPAPPEPPKEPAKPSVKPDKPAKPGQEELDKLLEEMEKDAREREEGSIDKQIEEWNKQLEELEKQLKEMGVMTETPISRELPTAKPRTGRLETIQEMKEAAVKLSIRVDLGGGRYSLEYGSGVILGCVTKSDRDGFICYAATVSHIFDFGKGKGKQIMSISKGGGVENRDFKLEIRNGGADVALISFESDTHYPNMPMFNSDRKSLIGKPAISVSCPAKETTPREIPECRVTAINRYLYNENIICTGLPEIGRSGGPLYVNGQLVGICSAQDPPGEGMYRDVSEIVKMIKGTPYENLPFFLP